MNTLTEIHDDMKGRTNMQRKRKKDFIKHFVQKIKDKEMTKMFCSATGIKRKYFTEGCLDDKARKRRKDSVPLMTEHNVTEYFYSEANSKTIPDKKSVKNDLQQRHVLLTSLRRAWPNWNDQHPTQKMSLAAFCKLRSKYFLNQKHQKLFSASVSTVKT